MKKFVIVCLMMVIGMGAGIYCKRSVTASATGEMSPTATVTLSTGDTFTIELYPEDAPNTVNNFLYLAGIGFYDNTKMSRSVPSYLVQLGDPIGNGKGFPGYFIKSECHYNGVSNHLRHTEGTVSMARSDQFNTEGSQFFVTLDDATHLNGQYSAFGKVTEGLDVLKALSHKPTYDNERPIEAISIQSITVDTLGKIYDEPEVLSVQEVLALYE